MSRTILSTFVAFAFTAGSVLGHTVWIEPLKDGLVVRFAEPRDDFETSPGHLDSLTAPIAFKVVTNAPVTVEAPKSSDHFALPGTAKTNVVCVESIFTVRGGRKPYFYARWQPDWNPGAKPLLTFDIIPGEKAGEARAYFRGEPLAGAKAILRTPDGKEEDLVSDSDGKLRFETSQKGQYLLTIPHHRESLAGFHGGKPYQQISHNAALSWTQR